MSNTDIVERIMRESQERRSAEQTQRRREFFTFRTDIPDLYFSTPDCSVCDASTECDGDSFYCEGCKITWRMNGYGHEAHRETDLYPEERKAFRDEGIVPTGWQWCPDCNGEGVICVMNASPDMGEHEYDCTRCVDEHGIVRTETVDERKTR